jgi:hypothetical protein
MKTIYFDCFAGASGDMIAGVFLDLGLDIDYLKSELAKLQITGYEIIPSRVTKNGISAMQFEVFIKHHDHHILADSEYTEEDSRQAQHDEFPEQTHSHEAHRALSEIFSIIHQSTLAPKIKGDIEKIFLRLGQAEASVHGTNIQDIHLHEVGAIDAIVDIATAAIGFNWLQASAIIISPIHLGSGFISAAHGKLPVPAPATAQLVKGMPIYSTGATGELLTPTGAAILSTYATAFGSIPKMSIEKIGYGAGKRDRDFPNVLRAFVGEMNFNHPNSSRNPSPEQHQAALQPGGYHEGEALMLVANIDDMNPQLLGNLMDKLLAAGVMDITFTPIFMKKNRPATSIEVMVAPDMKDDILAILFTESTTIGVRSYLIRKHMLEREIRIIDTEFGPVQVKISRLSNQIVNLQPEYEDCVRIAETYHLPVKEVYQSVLSSLNSLKATFSG